MSKKHNLIGKHFGELVVSAEAPARANGGGLHWECICACGVVKTIKGASLIRGASKTCGSVGCGRKHGKRGTKVYQAWKSMNSRCRNKKDKRYSYYGGRGISICERWNYFKNFYKDMGDPPSKKHSIDRVETNGNYEPANCRWGTPLEQANNRRNNHLVNYNGRPQTLAQACISHNINYDTVERRINLLGWNKKEALETPIKKTRQKIMILNYETGEDLCIAENVKDAEYLSGIKKGTIYFIASGRTQKTKRKKGVSHYTQVQSNGFSFRYLEKSCAQL